MEIICESKEEENLCPKLVFELDSESTKNSTDTGSGGIIELGQETVSILVITGICVLLLLVNVIIWFCGCRRHSKRNEEERQDRQYERDRYNDKKTHGTPFSKKKKVADKPILVKKQDHSHEQNEQDHHLESKIDSDETMEEFESRVRQQFSTHNVMEEIREERSNHTTPIKNKQLEKFASAAGSAETLQRNDSKVNVFNTDKLEEVDLNPALNNSINLETI